jgi:hypothetical protein
VGITLGLLSAPSPQSSSWVGNRYDGFGRLIETSTNMGGFLRTLAHQYDREGRRTETTFPDGRKFWTAPRRGPTEPRSP